MSKPVVYIISQDLFIADALKFHAAVSQINVRVKSRSIALPKSAYSNNHLWFLDHKGLPIEDSVRTYWEIRGEELFGMVPLIFYVDSPEAFEKKVGVGEHLWAIGDQDFTKGLLIALREIVDLLTRNVELFHTRMDIFNAELNDNYEEVQHILESIPLDDHLRKFIFAAYCNIAIKAGTKDQVDTAVCFLERAQALFPEQEKVIGAHLKLVRKSRYLRKSG